MFAPSRCSKKTNTRCSICYWDAESPYSFAFSNPILFVDPDGRENMIYSWVLNGGDEDKEKYNKIVETANKFLADLGVETKFAVAVGDFDVDKMDDTDKLSIMGTKQDVINAAKEKGILSDSDVDWVNENWTANVLNPEKSDFQSDGSGKWTFIDTQGVTDFTKESGISESEGVALTAIHGVGHQVGINGHQSDTNGGFMNHGAGLLSAINGKSYLNGRRLITRQRVVYNGIKNFGSDDAKSKWYKFFKNQKATPKEVTKKLYY